MKKGVAIVYLTIIMVFLLAFLFFDIRVKVSDKSAGDSMKIAVINMVSAETKENISVCDDALVSKKVKISIPNKGLIRFMASSDKMYNFGADATEKWQAIKDGLNGAGLLGNGSGVAEIEAAKIPAALEMLNSVGSLFNKAMDNGYDFDF